MKIARWTTRTGEIGEGFVMGEAVIPFPGDHTVASVLAAGLEQAQRMFATLVAGDGPEGVELAEVTLLAPLVPASIRDFVAFEEHVEGVSAGIEGERNVAPEWHEAPTFYFTNPHTVRASGERISVPETQRLDFELELAAVIGGVPGSNGEHLSIDEAREHIFGYTVMNDWSARDLQAREMQVRLGPAKGKDFAMTLGPWIVSADELESYLDADGFLAVRAEVWVNDTLIGEDLVSNMGWPFPELVSYAARNSVVKPGDVLGCGTVGNGGCLGELWGRNGSLTPPPLQPGDEVRMRIEGVGEIVNEVGDRLAGSPIPPARQRTRARHRGA